MTPTYPAPAQRPVNPCRRDPDLFFSDDPDDIEAAKNICGGCPSRLACLTYANDHELYHGVWGGLTGDERLHQISGGSKQCHGCQMVRPLGLFHRNARDGYSSQCKTCEKRRDAERNALRKPQLDAYKRAARQRKREAAA
ncbi:WhiB family transcriptional regulator [Actinomadura decatromicini]|uniref:Transcriptional regulator WhiB n=2 Tax=Actinomadura decatromicini TaxID=2604572 RepID=A0A5D3FB70_9ACTN|nr:WhiB family transcriptional regulator [Actinomadura decatromicini]